MSDDLRPQFSNTVSGQRRIGNDGGRPACRPRRENVEGRAVFRRRDFGSPDIVAVGFVDCNHVGKFDDAFLEALQFIAGTGEHENQEEVGHIGNRSFRLTDADRFHDHDIIAGGLADQHGLSRFCRDATKCS